MMWAEQLIGGRTSRYKMKVIHDVPLDVRGDLSPVAVLQALEQFHEEDWQVCAVAPGAGGTLCISYCRKGA